MTALSPGPWTLRCGQVFDADGRWLADMGDRNRADGRAMASAHEALAVLKELSKPEDELLAEFCQTTGYPAADAAKAHSAGRQRFIHWIWLRNNALRTKAEAVLEKAVVER